MEISNMVGTWKVTYSLSMVHFISPRQYIKPSGQENRTVDQGGDFENMQLVRNLTRWFDEERLQRNLSFR